MPYLVDTYLEWKHPPDVSPIFPDTHVLDTLSDASSPLTDDHAQVSDFDAPPPDANSNTPLPAIIPDDYSFDIEVLNIYTLETHTQISRKADSISTAVDLVKAGYLGATSISPSVAISLKTLELFRRI
ncbi:hypothetical protein EW146_g7142 [Bondarzewia mesenterica]|uniref:Uncharacterized protein n=1 Tax=Bondarzewia mesenterica TaxID=1095465 RepID=A0A4S4LLR8_9AGAM|nr:hypothetical protein EW146_g7142 [Bondarzewia mesenterica]